MSLPIISQSSDSLLRLFARSELHWSQHLAEEAQLDFGTAFANPNLPDVPEANCLLDVTVPTDVSPGEIVAQAIKFFAERKSRCLRWAINPGDDSSVLTNYFRSSGYTINHRHLLYLTESSHRQIERENLTILPARSSFKHAKAIASEWSNAEAELLHLDDPHTDAFLALHDGKPAAYLATLTMGEVGVIENLYVSETFRRQGFGRAMMSRVIELASRAQWRHVLMAVPEKSDGLLELSTQWGFKKIADWPEYHPAAASYAAPIILP